MYMKKQFIILSESWTPSKVYDENTSLIWVNNYKLFVKIYENKKTVNDDIKYAIHKDVYQAFRYMYKQKKMGNNKKTRKLTK